MINKKVEKKVRSTDIKFKEILVKKMKNLILIFSIFLIFSCEKKEEVKHEEIQNNKVEVVGNQNILKPTKKSDVTIESFKEFRNALYQNDLKKVKEFIDFPITDDINSTEFWALANDNFIGEEKPFTEKDFDKYHSKIFSKGFVNSILKIKSEQIFDEEGYSTQKIGGNKFYIQMKITTENNKDGDFLNLDLLENKEFDSEMNPGEKVMEETSTRYIFEILENGKIKFLRLQLAG